MVQALCRRNGTGPYSRSGSTKAELAAPFIILWDILWGDFGGEGPPRPAKRYWRRFPESEHMRRHLGGRVQRGIRPRPKGRFKGWRAGQLMGQGATASAQCPQFGIEI